MKNKYYIYTLIIIEIRIIMSFVSTNVNSELNENTTKMILLIAGILLISGQIIYSTKKYKENLYTIILGVYPFFVSELFISMIGLVFYENINALDMYKIISCIGFGGLGIGLDLYFRKKKSLMTKG